MAGRIAPNEIQNLESPATAAASAGYRLSYNAAEGIFSRLWVRWSATQSRPSTENRRVGRAQRAPPCIVQHSGGTRFARTTLHLRGGKPHDEAFEYMPWRDLAIPLQIEIGLEQPAVELAPPPPAEGAELPLALLQDEGAIRYRVE